MAVAIKEGTDRSIKGVIGTQAEDGDGGDHSSDLTAAITGASDDRYPS